MSKETFGDLLAPNLDAIRRFVRQRLRSPDHADDVLQQTLLLAFVHRDQLRTPAKFKSWLWSIAVNEVRMFLRSSRACLSLDEFPHFEIADSRNSPFMHCEAAQRQARLEAAILRLHARDQAAIRLELEGLSVREMAAATSASVSAAKSARFRARRRLVEAVHR
ncbi:MAG TPA: sigma-70 family RNA polymerase sigma factor [Bryobacteraceae bacterium]|nr:sigma-70 family RNA polymerase sigma factor [Bryobacteraceae bacterium]